MRCMARTVGTTRSSTCRSTGTHKATCRSSKSAICVANSRVTSSSTIRAGGRRQRQNRRNAEEALRLIRSFGIDVVPFDLPDVAVETIDFLRYVETAAAFYDITMEGQLTETEEGPEQSQRPNEIRAAHFTPAVEYIQGNRQRMRIMQQMDDMTYTGKIQYLQGLYKKKVVTRDVAAQIFQQTGIAPADYAR